MADKDSDWVVLSRDVDSPGEVQVVLGADGDDGSSDHESEDLDDGFDHLHDSAVDERTFLAAAGPTGEYAEALRRMVLPRLPVKSLISFRAVSPSWQSFLTSPFFVLSHAIRPRSLSGVLFNTPDAKLAPFVPDQLPQPSFSFLPEASVALASSRGLVCLRGIQSGRYYIANPAIRSFAMLPEPAATHGPDAAVVLVFASPDEYNFTFQYYVVVTFPVVKGVYAFERFSGSEKQWLPVGGALAPVERVMTTSGVSARGRAYWRTSMNTILAYDPILDESQLLYPPSLAVDPYAMWEIGEMVGKLSLTTVSRPKDSDYIDSTGERIEYICTTGVRVVRVCVDVSPLSAGPAGCEDWQTVALFEATDKYLWHHEEGALLLRSQGAEEIVVWDNSSEEIFLVGLNGQTLRSLSRNDLIHGFDVLPYCASLIEVQSGEDVGNFKAQKNSSDNQPSSSGCADAMFKDFVGHFSGWAKGYRGAGSSSKKTEPDVQSGGAEGGSGAAFSSRKTNHATTSSAVEGSSSSPGKKKPEYRPRRVVWSSSDEESEETPPKLRRNA